MLEAALVHRKCGLSVFTVLIYFDICIRIFSISWFWIKIRFQIRFRNRNAFRLPTVPLNQKVTVPAVPDQVPNTGKIYQDNAKKSPEKALSRCAVRPV